MHVSHGLEVAGHYIEMCAVSHALVANRWISLFMTRVTFYDIPRLIVCPEMKKFSANGLPASWQYLANV